MRKVTKGSVVVMGHLSMKAQGNKKVWNAIRAPLPAWKRNVVVYPAG